MTIVIILSAVSMLVFGVYAVMEHSILRSAIGLALASASLAVLFYALDAVMASVFELSVCSGLVTVIFISGVSLSLQPKVELQQEYKDGERSRMLPVVLIAVGAVLVALAYVLQGAIPEFVPDIGKNFQEIFWNTRQADVWGQIAAILCGGIAVAVLFREERR